MTTPRPTQVSPADLARSAGREDARTQFTAAGTILEPQAAPHIGGRVSIYDPTTWGSWEFGREDAVFGRYVLGWQDYIEDQLGTPIVLSPLLYRGNGHYDYMIEARKPPDERRIQAGVTRGE